ncbi:MAG: uL15m family ribosomal protein [Bacteroidota bacterium]
MVAQPAAGHKGAQSRQDITRSSASKVVQMPLQRRIPKFGFKNNNKVYFKSVNLDILEDLATKIKGSEISVQVLIDNGIVGKKDKVTVLGRGELKSKVNVSAHAFSETATQAIQKVGGTVTTI